MNRSYGWDRREHGGFSNYAGGGDRDSGRPVHEHDDTFHPPQYGPHYGKGPKGYRRADDRIHEELCETIARQGIVDASDVEVFVLDGAVRLVGTVEHRFDKRALEQIAERVHGVSEVVNEIRIRRTETR
jgi:osmotically-inducible protein OsmY